jgi:hypothetical protein
MINVLTSTGNGFIGKRVQVTLGNSEGVGWRAPWMVTGVILASYIFILFYFDEPAVHCLIELIIIPPLDKGMTFCMSGGNGR